MVDLARTPQQIGAVIRRARKRKGLTQTELGLETGLRQETISLIEAGKPGSKLDTILIVLAALGLEFQIATRTRRANDLEDLVG